MKKVRYQSNETGHKWKLQYPYPVPSIYLYNNCIAYYDTTKKIINEETFCITVTLKKSPKSD